MSYFAAMMSRAYPAVNNALRNFDGALICVNQWRADPNNQWDPRVPVGGNAWKYLFSLIIDFKKLLLRDEKDKKIVLGDRVSGDILKSKVCEPRRKFEYQVKYGIGVVHQLEFKEAAIQYGILSKTGNTFFFEGEKICVGEPDLDKLVFDNEEFAEKLKEAVLEYDRKQFSGDIEVPTEQQSNIQDIIEGPETEGSDGDVSVSMGEGKEEEL
jgi:RecA/RadA recombinase